MVHHCNTTGYCPICHPPPRHRYCPCCGRCHCCGQCRPWVWPTVQPLPSPHWYQPYKITCNTGNAVAQARAHIRA